MRETVLGPLEQAVSVSIQSYLTDLREDIKDEVARRTMASQAAYTSAVELCNSLIAVQSERDALNTRLNNNLPAGAAGSPVTAKAHPNWIDLAREQDEPAGATRNNTIENPFNKQLKVQWGLRATELRNPLTPRLRNFARRFARARRNRHSVPNFKPVLRPKIPPPNLPPPAFSWLGALPDMPEYGRFGFMPTLCDARPSGGHYAAILPESRVWPVGKASPRCRYPLYWRSHHAR